MWMPNAVNAQDLVDLVNPRIGNVSQGLMPTFPTVHRPYGMIRFWPLTSPGVIDTYLSDRIYGFPLNRPEYRGEPAITVMPYKGKKALLKETNGIEIDHDFEIVSPYYYSVQLDEMEMKVEFTPTERCAFFAFSSANTDDLVLLFETDDVSRFQLKGTQNLTGYETYKGVRQYVNIFFNHRIKESGYINAEGKLVKAKSAKGKGLKYFVVFDGSVQVLMNYAVSWIDNKQASRNLLKENPGWNFDKTVNAGVEAWNHELGKIEAKGGTVDQRVIFYTALYRTFERMVNVNEYGRYYSANDNKVHRTKHDIFVDDWIWDTYSSRHSLSMIIAPDREPEYGNKCLTRLAEAWGYNEDTVALENRTDNSIYVYNPEELIEMVGGKDAFVESLDQLFEESLSGYAKWGITGRFVMRNQPGFHASYLYTLAGQPWKTQKRVRQLMDTWFRNDIMDICGDEDGGGLSAWYVFSAMGFYPVTLGKSEYVLGSPIFEEVKMDLGNGNFFTIKAPFVSTQNKYIQSVKLNGEELDGYILTHQSISAGGTLVLDMGSAKN